MVLIPGVPRLSIEAGSPFGWERYTGNSRAIVGIDRFGTSAPGGTVLKKFGFTPENIAEKAAALLSDI